MDALSSVLNPYDPFMWHTIICFSIILQVLSCLLQILSHIFSVFKYSEKREVQVSEGGLVEVVVSLYWLESEIIVGFATN